MNNAAQAAPHWVGWASRPSIQGFAFMDLNGDAAETDDCDPDTAAGGEADQDRRYFVHQDRNWNVVALTEYDDGAGTDGRVAERYAYTPYGEFVVLTGDGGSGELGAVRPTSPAGNLFAHQGLAFDQEKGSYQNRHREYAVGLERFGQRDPLAPVDGTAPNADQGMSAYPYVSGLPNLNTDSSGQSVDFSQRCCDNFFADFPSAVAVTVCCCFVPTTCVNSNAPWSQPGMKDCAQKHENVHLNDCGCSDTPHNYTALPYAPCSTSNGDASECVATKAEMKCLTERIKDCQSLPPPRNFKCAQQYRCRIWGLCMAAAPTCKRAGIPMKRDCWAHWNSGCGFNPPAPAGTGGDEVPPGGWPQGWPPVGPLE